MDAEVIHENLQNQYHKNTSFMMVGLKDTKPNLPGSTPSNAKPRNGFFKNVASRL